jgi:hypothetical protein
MLNACRPDVPREEWHKVGTDFHRRDRPPQRQ